MANAKTNVFKMVSGTIPAVTGQTNIKSNVKKAPPAGSKAALRAADYQLFGEGEIDGLGTVQASRNVKTGNLFLTLPDGAGQVGVWGEWKKNADAIEKVLAAGPQLTAFIAAARQAIKAADQA